MASITNTFSRLPQSHQLKYIKSLKANISLNELIVMLYKVDPIIRIDDYGRIKKITPFEVLD